MTQINKSDMWSTFDKSKIEKAFNTCTVFCR